MSYKTILSRQTAVVVGMFLGAAGLLFVTTPAYACYFCNPNSPSFCLFTGQPHVGWHNCYDNGGGDCILFGGSCEIQVATDVDADGEVVPTSEEVLAAITRSVMEPVLTSGFGSILQSDFSPDLKNCAGQLLIQVAGSHGADQAPRDLRI
jgi:hypothetical protein